MSRSTLTLSLPREVIVKAKILAAQRRTSLSRLIAESIEDLASRDAAYQEARRSALEFLEKGFDMGARPLSREELHERTGVR